MELNVLALYAAAKIADLVERNHGVPEALRRHSIDEVDHAVLEPTDVEVVQHVRDQGSMIGFHLQMAPISQDSVPAPARQS